MAGCYNKAVWLLLFYRQIAKTEYQKNYRGFSAPIFRKVPTSFSAGGNDAVGSFLYSNTLDMLLTSE